MEAAAEEASIAAGMLIGYTEEMPESMEEASGGWAVSYHGSIR